MFEAKKTNLFRGDIFAETFLRGKVLDIGAGADLVCSHAQAFDLKHGDANYVDDYFEIESFDVVHSSHCLEHMHQPVDAIHRWWKLVKQGGYLIIVVPDETLYEQGIWPSLFNADHKSAFTLDDYKNKPHVFNLKKICGELINAEIVNVELQDLNYSYRLLFPNGKPNRGTRPNWLNLFFGILRRIPLMRWVHDYLLQQSVRFGYPIDQTIGDALAQIQIIVKKKKLILN
jgi:SAM-dependent methyltransferase